MPRPIRQERPELCVSVTVRCREGRRFLSPLDPMRVLLTWWLGRALGLFDVELFALVALSNHLHLLLRAPDGNLSAFMRYFLANAAKDINRAHGRRGDGVFGRHTQVHVLDDEAALIKLGYILANPVQAHLVERSEDWPGLSSARALLYGEPMSATRFDHRAWVRAGRPADRSAFEREVVVEHKPLPGMEQLGVAERQARVREQLEVREAEARRRRTRAVPARAALDEAHPDVIPARLATGPCPACHATDPAREAAYLKERQRVREKHAEASVRFRAGEPDVEFPPGTYRPPFDAACRRLVA